MFNQTCLEKHSKDNISLGTKDLVEKEGTSLGSIPPAVCSYLCGNTGCAFSKTFTKVSLPIFVN